MKELIELLRKELNKRIVVTGIEGVSKSGSTIEAMLKIATKENPVLFAYKDYELLIENKEKLIERYGVDEKDICICGTNLKYEKALAAYTNPEKPKYMSWHSKFILCTQAVLQRNRHLSFYSSQYQNKKFSAIVVDEFDWRMCVIATLNYQKSRIKDDSTKENTEYDILQWIGRNYSTADYERLEISDETNDKYKNFVIANWLESSDTPVIFLTSETLPVRFLKLIGFTEFYLKSPNFKNCIVNVHSSKLVIGEMFQVMNDGRYWDEFGEIYDAIVSDKAVKFTDEESTDLLRKEETFDILNHTTVRGTNNYIGKNILTVLSHVPPDVLNEIQDIFHCFGDKISDEKIYQMFYRDRLCQAVGRVIGNRGGTETDLLAHESIVNTVADDETMPYTMKEFKLKHSKLDEIWEKTQQLQKENREKRLKYERKKAEEKFEQSVFELDELLVKKSDSYISSRELGKFLNEHNVKSKYGRKNIPIKFVCEHFGVETKRLTIDNLRTHYVVGLAFKNKNSQMEN